MKNIIIIFICLITFVLLPSCEKMMGTYLDKAPGVDVTQDTIFSSKTQVETAIVSMYRIGMHSTMPRDDENNTGGPNYVNLSTYCDEAYSPIDWTSNVQWNFATQTPDNITSTGEGEDVGRFQNRYKAIRMANILLERVAKVPELDATYINQVKGEARFIRALNYFEMFKRYGGMPICRKKFELTDNFLRPRNTVKEMVDFIVGDCDTAATLLPDVYPTNFTGRSTKGAALLLKAKTLLYAASPLYNANSPQISFADPSNNSLLVYGDYDLNRWQMAADAAKAVIDWAPSAGIALITNQGINNNYRYIFEVNDNSEVILANKCGDAKGIWDFPWAQMIPYAWYDWTWWMGYSMPVNFLEKYEKQDGTPQTWDPVGGNDLLVKYNQLDRRFLQTVCIVGAYWNADIPVNLAQDGGPYSFNNANLWITKFIPPSMTLNSYYAYPNDILFRLGEAYLDYAEALNEAQGPIAAAYTAVNTIRTRSGQPDLPAGLTQAQFRDRVRNERAVELYDEDHRLWDIKRWVIAEQDGVMQGAFYAHHITENVAPPNTYSYAPYVFQTRIWNKKFYAHPILRSEALKGYLIQNPGW